MRSWLQVYNKSTKNPKVQSINKKGRNRKKQKGIGTKKE
jgi:hypothetical protein